jgi:hypothetical protein
MDHTHSMDCGYCVVEYVKLQYMKYVLTSANNSKHITH